MGWRREGEGEGEGWMGEQMSGALLCGGAHVWSMRLRWPLLGGDTLYF